jgi:hypothetical protein
MPNGKLGIPDDCFYGDKVRDELKALWGKHDKLDERVDLINVKVEKMSTRVMIYSTIGAVIGSGFVSAAFALVVYLLTRH